MLYPVRVRAGVYAVVRNGRSVGILRNPRGTIDRISALDARHLYVDFGEGAAAGSSAESLWRSDDGGSTWRFVSRTDAEGTQPHAVRSPLLDGRRRGAMARDAGAGRTFARPRAVRRRPNRVVLRRRPGTAPHRGRPHGGRRPALAAPRRAVRRQQRAARSRER